MGHIDRDEALARTDLAELATEACGPATGHGRSAKWHCPNPDHPDRHPSMSVYPGKRSPRWKCHACGEGGTAVDLLMLASKLNAGEALRELANRLGMNPAEPATRPPSPAVPPATVPPAAGEPAPAIEEFVAQAAKLLWRADGADARQYLHDRGLTEPVLRANRVGYDPGPANLARPRGLPRLGPGIVCPVLDPASTAIYYQLRYLSPSASRKYDSPTVELAPNPKIAGIRTPEEPRQHGMLVVTEGLPDGLAAAHTGLPAAAVLGVGQAGTGSAADLATALVMRHPAGLYLVAFDNDKPGAAAAGRLAAHLSLTGATVARIVPPGNGADLNTWWQTDPDGLTRVLTASGQLAAPTSPKADLSLPQ